MRSSANNEVIIAKIDADAETAVAETYGVSSFPQIKCSNPFCAMLMTVFPKGSSKKEPIHYDKGRSEEEFVEFLNENAGTNRVVGGALNDIAGRIVELDELAKKLVAATNEAEMSSVFTEVEKVLAKSNLKYVHLKITNLQIQGCEILCKGV